MAKYKIIPSSRTIVQSPISIGHKAEKGVQAIEFDLTAWVETYGSGTLTVIMRRWGDAIPYPIALEIDENNKATWTLSDIDTAKAGMAYAQLNYIVGDEVVKKSDIYTFRVMDSLTGEGEPPEAYESWLEHLTHLAAEAMAEVLDIEGIVTDKTLTVDGGIADAKAAGDALALKADKSTTYTKNEVDQMIEDVEVETDTTLAVSGAPADAAETGRQFGLIKADLSEIEETIKNVNGVPNTVRQAIYKLFNNGAYEVTDLANEISIVEDWARINVIAIALSQNSIVFDGVGVQRLEAILTPPDTTDEVYWTSSDLAVAAVAQDGTVTSVGNGSCTVSASVGDLVALCGVSVVNMPDVVLIDKTLANCALSNTSNIAYKGARYVTNITADSGYTLGDVSVRMGGTDITSTAYSNGVITIANVTGKIEIDVFALPTGYTHYDYIQNTVLTPVSTEAPVSNIITLPLTGDKNMFKYDLMFSLDNATTEGVLFGGKDVGTGGGDSLGIYSKNGGNMVAFHAHGKDEGWFTFSEASTSGKHHLIFDPRTNPTKLILDNIEQVRTWADTSQTLNASIKLFTNATDNSNTWGLQTVQKFGRFRVYSSEDVLVGDYIPCKNSNNKAGFYDLVTSTFVTATTATRYNCGNWE